MEEKFKEIINEIKPILKEAGFMKKGLNFFKNSTGLVYVINIQKSHGNSHNEIGFYVNCGIHSNTINQELNLEAIEFPKEYQCHYQRRIEEISKNTSDKFLIDESINIGTLKAQIKKSIEDVVIFFQGISDNDLFVRHLSQYGTLKQNEVFRYCLKSNLAKEANDLVELFKKNIDNDRWEGIFKVRFSEILDEENSKIEIYSLK